MRPVISRTARVRQIQLEHALVKSNAEFWIEVRFSFVLRRSPSEIPTQWMYKTHNTRVEISIIYKTVIESRSWPKHERNNPSEITIAPAHTHRWRHNRIQNVLEKVRWKIIKIIRTIMNSVYFYVIGFFWIGSNAITEE